MSHKRRYMQLSACLFYLLAAASNRALAEVERAQVAASGLDDRATTVHGPHLISRDPAAHARHQLVVFLPGTGGIATEATEFTDPLARQGYHVIALDYPNEVTAAVFRPAQDPHAFDAYRHALVLGGSFEHQHEVWRITHANCIEARIAALLQHLAAQHPEDGWRDFYGTDGVIWDHLVLAGHSQGSGHAAFIAQQHRLAKVLVIAGPQDYLTALAQPAGWLSGASLTPRDRFRVLLHHDDEYDSSLQLKAARALLARRRAKPVTITDAAPSTAVAPQLVMSRRPLTPEELTERARQPKAPVAHRSLMRASYQAVWLYLLEH